MKASTLQFYKARLLRVLVYIQQHLDAPLPLDELAATACLAPHHFHHIFTGMLGESLAAHIRRLRLERAALRLKFTEMPVIQIALEAGYESHEAFSRAFKNSFHVPPSDHRRHTHPKLEIPSAAGVHFKTNGTVQNFRTAVKGVKTMNITIKKLKPMRVAFMRHVGPYQTVGKVWDEFTMRLGKDGLLGGDNLFLGICHDDPSVTAAKKLRYDACITVDKHFQPEGDIGVQTIAGGDYAVLTHFGPYNKLNESYAQLLGQWLPRSGRQIRTTPCFEIYFNSPENTEPEDLITDIHAPLE